MGVKVEFGEAFPGLFISTVLFTFALIDYAVASAVVNGNTQLAVAFFGAPLPVVGTVKALVPLSTPPLVVTLVKIDAVGLVRSPKFAHFLGVLQLATLGGIFVSVARVLLPAIDDVKDGDVTPADAVALYAAHARLLALNAVMLVCGVVKMRLGADVLVDDEKSKKPATAATKKSD